MVAEPALHTDPAGDALAGRREQTRQRILDAALALFVAKGYVGTTMDDIGAAMNMKGPSLYRHVRSKHELLVELMERAIADVQADFDAAVATTDDPVTQLRRAMEAHVRFHTQRTADAFLGSRELGNLEEPQRSSIITRRKSYERSFRRLVQAGVDAGRLDVRSAKLAAIALLDLGTGVAVWFRPDGGQTADQIVYHHGDLAMRLVGAHD